jgi:hypothetical protein
LRRRKKERRGGRKKKRKQPPLPSILPLPLDATDDDVVHCLLELVTKDTTA